MPGDAVSFGFPVPGAGLTVKLADGETRERADVTLARWGSIEGHALDELGEPLQGVSVQVMQVRYQAGRRRLVAAAGASPITDDLGRFRIYGMAPGAYIVSATIGDVGTDDLPGYTRSYYPGTANASEAQFVSVGLSQQMTGVDFSLARVRTANVSGILLNAAGEPATGGAVRLVPSQRSASVTSCRRSDRINLPDAPSSDAVGSSQSTMSGLPTTARAIATRCCCPPLSWRGACWARSASPTRSSAASARLRRSLRDQLSNFGLFTPNRTI